MSATVFMNAAEILDGTTVLSGSALAIADGRVAAVGPQEQVLSNFTDAVHIDCSGRVLSPGFVDSHTHAVFGGWRAAEYEMRSEGLDYMEIARRGGGINASVESVRALPEDALLEMALSRLHAALRHGTTTIEIKSPRPCGRSR
jgi:imidazolonepropionase